VEFSSVHEEAGGFVVPSGSRFRMRAANLISMEAPWGLDDVVEFLLKEFGDAPHAMNTD
jgi:hypothetical protein